MSSRFLEDVGEQLQAYDLTRADEDSILIVDDTIVEKAKTSAAEIPDSPGLCATVWRTAWSSQ